MASKVITIPGQDRHSFTRKHQQIPVQSTIFITELHSVSYQATIRGDLQQQTPLRWLEKPHVGSSEQGVHEHQQS